MEKINYYKCSTCDKITRHIRVSGRECSAISKETKIEQTAAFFGDILGINKGFETVLGRACYKCCQCGNVTMRNTSGDVIGSARGYDRY